MGLLASANNWIKSIVSNIAGSAIYQETIQNSVAAISKSPQGTRDRKIRAIVAFLLETDLETRKRILALYQQKQKDEERGPEISASRLAALLSKIIICAKAEPPENNVQRIINRFNEHTPQEQEQILEWADRSSLKTFLKTLKANARKALRDKNGLIERIKSTSQNLDQRAGNSGLGAKISQGIAARRRKAEERLKQTRRKNL